MKKWLPCFLLSMSILAVANAQDLSLSPQDLHMEWDEEGGYHLWIRKKPDIASVLLTESTADPEKKNAVYSLRNPEYHPVNGDEKRILNGEFLEPSKDLYSLIDSTPEPFEPFGSAFHIFIPYIVKYGYPYTRHGEILVYAGTYLNVRTFEDPYADYRGAFNDNPFIIDYKQPEPKTVTRLSSPVVPPSLVSAPKPRKPVPKPVETPTPPPPLPPFEEPPPPPPPEEEPPPDNAYDKTTVDNFREIATEGKGTVTLSGGEEKMIDEIGTIINKAEGKTLDLVLALDTTQSMSDDLPYLRDLLVPLLREETQGFDSFRIGLVLYRDYMEQYLTRISPFQEGLEAAQREINKIVVRGGRDIPEAVYEALYAGVHTFPWEADSRLIILIGDAPAHSSPRGKVTKEMVYRDAESLGIELHTIILPH